MWEEVVKKAGDTETKANLQPSFYIREIDFRCPKDHRPLGKKDKKDSYQEPQNEAYNNKNKAKSHNSSTSANQPQTQAPKKDKRGCRGGYGGHLATGVNATEVAKKDKTLKDLSHIKCYICHQNGHYATKCRDKPKNSDGLDNLHVNV